MKKKSLIDADYGQVGLWDTEDKTSYPQYETGTEKYILGPKGIVISVTPDHKIQTVVLIDEDDDQMKNLHELFSSNITIGSKGLSYGNIPASDIHKINISKGNYDIKAYVNSKVIEKITTIVFSMSSS